MKLCEHQINMLYYTLILIVIQDNSYFNEFFVYYTSYSNFSTSPMGKNSMCTSY